MSLDRFNALSLEEARTALLSCCGSHAWAGSVANARPYGTVADVLEQSSALWLTLREPDWLEAFACHPRIGEVKAPTDAFLTHSTSEQSATQQTLANVASQLVEGNRAYEARFGFLYIVFASGRSAPELLAVLRQRLTHTRDEELREAARQQDRITRLRLERNLTS